MKIKKLIVVFFLLIVVILPANITYARAGGGHGGGHSGGHSSHSSHNSRSRGGAHRVSSGGHISSGNSEDSQEEKKFTFEDKVISGVVVIVLVTISIKRTREALKEIK
ncbi:hypothetical protein QYB59_001609 [Clostridium perfringens]|nr:hypothetical protein [Clostridium perfringens]